VGLFLGVLFNFKCQRENVNYLITPLYFHITTLSH